MTAAPQAFSQWAAKGPGEALMRLPLLLFVTLGRHIDPQVLAGALHQQRDLQAALLSGYRALQKDVRESGDDPYLVAVVDFAAMNSRMTVRWLDNLPSKLLDGTPTEPAAPTDLP